ncbi:hypothetical protein Q5H92_11270 [Hymenobacter sp. M29]|uniref:Leucine rich repeat-containing protein n=1 Tax=Hymenobacter mellowenesis TaxID=3063995 RepID=A0ABT9AAS9_9BACT|nr:hypothetical protein [Hymenobacter sp. M29]MDO7846940.1 hypothetical protein [Hymenobacter sp. M29]
MYNSNILKSALCLLVGAMPLTCCTRAEKPDDFTNLKVFESELSQLCRLHPEMRCSPSLNVSVGGGHVLAINIDGRGIGGQGLNRLPNSIYQFKNLMEFSLLSTDFEQIPDLRPFKGLRKVTIEYNRFKGPVHLKNLPPSIEDLMLSRDGIKEVIVDDSLPNLSLFDLTQNLMDGRINSTFCKLPNLQFLDISSGCCLSDAEQTRRANAAKEVLCKKDVGVSANRSFTD